MWRHYAAPITGLLFVLVLQAMRHLRVCQWHGRRTGRFIVWAMVVLCIAFAPLHRGKVKGWNLDRARILARLQEGDDRHLIVVRYWPSYSPHAEWVYNEAIIDSAKVVRAREIDAAYNRQLLEYFKDRRVWLLEPDAPVPRLTPYVIGSSP